MHRLAQQKTSSKRAEWGELNRGSTKQARFRTDGRECFGFDQNRASGRPPEIRRKHGTWPNMVQAHHHAAIMHAACSMQQAKSVTSPTHRQKTKTKARTQSGNSSQDEGTSPSHERSNCGAKRAEVLSQNLLVQFCVRVKREQNSPIMPRSSPPAGLQNEDEA